MSGEQAERKHAPRRRKSGTVYTLFVISVILLSSCVCAQAVDSKQQKLRRTTAAVLYDRSTKRTSEERIEPVQKVQDNGGKMTRIAYVSDSQKRYPWFTRLVATDKDSNDYSCDGALIAKDLVLTAASCRDSTKAHIGLKNGNDPAKYAIKVQASFRHPNSVDNDVMIVQLTEPALEISPIRMNFDENYPIADGESLAMLGFGNTVGFPRLLEAATTLYVPFEFCAVAEDPNTGVVYGTSTDETIVQPNWFCSTNPANVTIVDATDNPESPVMTTTCFGDSGGPIIKEAFFSDAEITSNSVAWATDDLLLAVISETSRYCGNPHLPTGNQRVSSYKQWIVETGCALSIDPPAEWKCASDTLIVPSDNTVYYSNPELTMTPTKSPSTKPTATPTSTPTPNPTPFPTTEKPNPFPIPNPTYAERPEPAPVLASYDDEDDDRYNYVYVCPICGKNEGVTNPDSIVFVPVLGQKTCQELVTAASKGKIEKGGECDSVLLVATAVCSCAKPTDEPTGSPTARPSVAPTGRPTPKPSAPPTRRPTPKPSAPPTNRPTANPSAPPTNRPTANPSAPPTNRPTANPSAPPTKSPSLRPSTLSPTNRPPSPPTCSAIQLAKYDESKLIDVFIDFSFLDSSSARTVGWYIADPGHECFRVGVSSGAYGTRSVKEKLTLVKNVEYMFVLEVDTSKSYGGKEPSGSYSITSMGVLLGSRDTLENKDTIRFTTPH